MGARCAIFVSSGRPAYALDCPPTNQNKKWLAANGNCVRPCGYMFSSTNKVQLDILKTHTKITMKEEKRREEKRREEKTREEKTRQDKRREEKKEKRRKERRDEKREEKRREERRREESRREEKKREEKREKEKRRKKKRKEKEKKEKKRKGTVETNSKVTRKFQKLVFVSVAQSVSAFGF